MLADRRRGTDVVGEGADAGARCDTGVNKGAERVVGFKEASLTVRGRCLSDETVRTLLPVEGGPDDGDVDVESTIVLEVVAGAIVVAAGVGAFVRARFVRAAIEITIAITEAPKEATGARRRERTRGVG